MQQDSLRQDHGIVHLITPLVASFMSSATPSFTQYQHTVGVDNFLCVVCFCIDHAAMLQEPSRKRHLLRLQLVVPQLRPLPAAAFDALWGPLAADDRCAEQLAALGDAAELQVAAAAATEDAAGNGAGVSAALAARFGGSGMGCIPLDAELGNKPCD
jgi:hypothetical protein